MEKNEASLFYLLWKTIKKHGMEPASTDLKNRGNQLDGCRASPEVQVCTLVSSLIPFSGLETSEVLLGDTKSLSYSWEEKLPGLQ